MTLTRAIDMFLEQMRVERDWTPRTIQSYRATYDVLAKDHPDADLADFTGRNGTDKLRATLARHWGRTSAGTRANRISHLHSFFQWAENEGHIEDDPARRLKRPPRRRADIYRPPAADVELALSATTLDERAAWILMARRGFRASTICALRWNDLDLQRGLARVQVKGGHRDWVPLGPQATGELQDVYRQLAPDHNDHIFTVERELEHGGYGRRRVRRDPKRPASTKTLWMMVRRVCARADVRLFGPHALRHSFATTFARQTRERYGVADKESLQALMGHASGATTDMYLDPLRDEDLSVALGRAAGVASVAGVGDGDEGVGRSGLRGLGAPGGVEPPVAGSGDAEPGDTERSGESEPVDAPNPCHKVETEGGADEA